MNSEIKTIRSLGLRSTAKLFAAWYGFWGTVAGIVYLFSRPEHLNVPFGLFVPFVDLHLNFSIVRAPTFSGVIVQAVLFNLFCAASGWVSGILVALLYNLASKYLGFQLTGSTETQQLTET